MEGNVQHTVYLRIVSLWFVPVLELANLYGQLSDRLAASSTKTKTILSKVKQK